MKYYIFALLIFISSIGLYGQNTDMDSCSITPVYTASIEGIDKKGMLSADDLAGAKKLIAADKSVTILRFTYSIDCDGCDMYVQDVYADTIPEEELKLIKAMKPMQVLSFECIVGKNKQGELVTCKPFLFYIKP